MAKLDPPVALADPQNVLRLTYIQDVITPLPEYETGFPPVNYFVFFVFNNFVGIF